MEDIDVYLVFDRYYKYSINGQTRKQRTGNISNHHIFSMNTPLPGKEVTLISSANKVQLIDLISRYIIEKLRCVTFHGRFIVTFSDPTPVQVEGGIATPRTDLRTTHEEADVNIIRQCLSCIEDGAKCVKVLCDDTDVFILLTVYAFRYQVQSQILMESFSSNRTLVNINETCKKHAAIVPSLIGAHAISGCDGVSKLFGIGKRTVLKYSQQNIQLTSLGNISSTKEVMFNES